MAKGASPVSDSLGASISTAQEIGALRPSVQQVLDLIRPAVQSDGGDVELVNVTPDGVVHVRLHGACVGCPSSAITLQTGIERSLKQRVPGVTRVVAVA
jgi:Fe-S cluster biogenesis protein NfuA